MDKLDKVISALICLLIDKGCTELELREYIKKVWEMPDEELLEENLLH